MNQIDKDLYLAQATTKLKLTQQIVAQVKQQTIFKIAKIKKDFTEFNDDDKIVQLKLYEMNNKKLDELELMADSPYFSKCEVDFGKVDSDIIYIGKFSLSEQQIYSWISPIAKIRFAQPGPINYLRPDKTQRDGLLKQKDQYLITNGQIKYLSREQISHGRELIYQDYFSNQKKDFVLPEIVAQMEQAQDTVIRASYKNALLISGPAGSGKTTLALHRVAYLLQSPDVSDRFNAHKILILVQDQSTKDYFSLLLPELGIKNINIQTFSQWAIGVLGLDYTYQYRIGQSEQQKDEFEFFKLSVLNNLSRIGYQDDIISLLDRLYSDLPAKLRDLFIYQKNNRVLDRIDLTILLQLYRNTYQEITMEQEYYEMRSGSLADKKIGRFPIKYDLVIFDEFQNYLPQQINIIKSCLNNDNNSVVYVGDMNQQTQLGTLKDWSQINELLPSGRQVKLKKVYRNTKQIISYIKQIGYNVEIPDNPRDGSEVVEKIFDNIDDEIKYVQANLKSEVSTGIIARDNNYLEKYRLVFADNKNVHILSMDEVQGVEFDSVFIVGVQQDNILSADKLDNIELKTQKQKIDRDLLYVALTRAMNSLYVLGLERLSQI